MGERNIFEWCDLPDTLRCNVPILKASAGSRSLEQVRGILQVP